MINLSNRGFPMLHLFTSGAYLMGGATIHKPDCPIQKLIEEYFPYDRKNPARGIPPPEE